MALRIKDIIKQKRITVQDLADKMSISRVGLSQHINGNPSVEVLERIATALEVEVWELFDRKSDTELTALVEYRKNFYKADTLEGLKDIVKQIEKKL